MLEDVKNDIVDHCKREFPGPIIIGGPSVGISGKEMLEYFDLEYAVRRDGEAVMSEFVKRLGSHAKEVLREVIRKKPDLRKSKRFSFRFPNFYFYQKENITPG